MPCEHPSAWCVSSHAGAASAPGLRPRIHEERGNGAFCKVSVCLHLSFVVLDLDSGLTHVCHGIEDTKHEGQDTRDCQQQREPQGIAATCIAATGSAVHAGNRLRSLRIPHSGVLHCVLRCMI